MPSELTEIRQVSEEVAKEVAAAIQKATKEGMLQFVSSWSCIAAQFKNSYLRSSSLSATEIEGGLSKVVDSLSSSQSLLAKEVADSWKLTYSDDGSGGLYGPGVRVFKFEKK